LLEYILYPLYILACVVLILFVLLQPGKSDASAVFGGGASSTAFGPRGTATVLAKITIGAAIAFFLIAFLFSVPGITEKKSLGEGVGPAQSQAPAPEPAPVVPETPPSPTPAQPGDKPATESKSAPAEKPGGNKNGSTQSKQK
jgi:preprotein translocase subunit SecG